jgi:hypothetical protein
MKWLTVGTMYKIIVYFSFFHNFLKWGPTYITDILLWQNSLLKIYMSFCVCCSNSSLHTNLHITEVYFFSSLLKPVYFIHSLLVSLYVVVVNICACWTNSDGDFWANALIWLQFCQAFPWLAQYSVQRILYPRKAQFNTISSLIWKLYMKHSSGNWIQLFRKTLYFHSTHHQWIYTQNITVIM